MASCRITFFLKHIFFYLTGIFLCLQGQTQSAVRGVVADSATHQPLAFATVRVEGQQKGIITGINGHFALTVPEQSNQLIVSYIGYSVRQVAIASLKNNDTVYLSPSGSTLGEVVIRSDFDKIKRIVNRAIRNKPDNNPEFYDLYSCYVYYKMKVDLVPQTGAEADSARVKRQRRIDKAKAKEEAKRKELPDMPLPDSGINLIQGNNHIIFSESYSKRVYKRPQQVYEEVIASRFSGLKKTWFTNLVTDVLPFHVYSDYISLNGKDYLNPIAKGWQQRYEFRIADEISSGDDTTYILSFEPKKGAVFNSLHGLVYINTNGYAISHFIGSTGDANNDREIRVEQIYHYVNGRWFPKELNYDLVFNAYPTPYLGLKMNGHSVIDSVSYTRAAIAKMNKAYPVRLGDSVDLYSEQQWKKFRPDTISTREQNTYRVIDSLSEKKNLQGFVYTVGKIGVGKFPVKMVDIDIPRLVAFNDYEGTRLGLGLSTNNKVSKYFSIGGWFGYGTKDKAWKYGYHATIFPAGNKDNWLRLAYRQDLQSTGNVNIHSELFRTGFRNWILTQVDRVKEYSLTGHTQRGYWQLEAGALTQQLVSLYANNFETQGKNITAYDVKEASFGIRYAYGEKRVPIFEYYLPAVTKYPILYLKAATGRIKGDVYSANYIRSLAALTFRKHINRWGYDNFSLEAGLIRSQDNQPFPRSLLLAGNGFRLDRINFYASGGFITMRPYDYFADRYASFCYKHDFDKQLWDTKFSRPFISIAHNLLYGGLREETKTANPGIVSASNGYHESGLLLNQLYQMDFLRLAHIYINAGAFYHWSAGFDWKKNGVFVIGFATGF